MSTWIWILRTAQDGWSVAERTGNGELRDITVTMQRAMESLVHNTSDERAARAMRLWAGKTISLVFSEPGGLRAQTGVLKDYDMMSLVVEIPGPPDSSGLPRPATQIRIDSLRIQKLYVSDTLTVVCGQPGSQMSVVYGRPVF